MIYGWLLSPPKYGWANYKVLRQQERLQPFTKIIIIIGRTKNILWQCAGLTIAHPASFVSACTFRTVPRSWSWPVLCKNFGQLHSFARCFSTKTWLIKPDNVTKSSKMGPHVIQNSKKCNCCGEVDELSEDSANGDDRCPRVYAPSSAVARTEHE